MPWRPYALSFVLVVAATATVHRSTLDAALSHHDRFLVAAARGGVEAPAAVPAAERIAMIEGRLVGGRSADYRWIGLILLVATAFTLGAAVRRTFPVRGGRDRTFPIDAGTLAAVVFAAAPIHVDATASLPGHARLLGLLAVCLALTVWSATPRVAIGVVAVALLVPVLGGSATSWPDHAVTCALWTAAPAPPSLEARAAAAFRISFGGLALAAVAWSLVAGRGERGRVLTLLAVCAAAIVCAAFAFDDGDGVAGASVALLPAAALAALLGVALDAVARRGVGEVVALALVVFQVYSSANATALLGPSRDQEVAPGELQLIVEQLGRIDARFRRVVVLGVPATMAAARPVEALVAASAAPWRREPRRVFAAVDGAHGDLPAHLLAPDAPTLVVEWRASHPFAKRPADWRLMPLVGASSVSDRIALVSPRADAELSTRRPETIEDDVAFTFDVVGDRPLRTDEAFVFTAMWEGGRTPRGRDRVTARRLADSVLSKSRTATGATRYRWRTSIRPGKGEDGVYFDDPDMELAGKTIWWTVGIARVAVDEADDDHAGHDHGEGSRTPHDVAQTRRATFR